VNKIIVHHLVDGTMKTFTATSEKIVCQLEPSGRAIIHLLDATLIPKRFIVLLHSETAEIDYDAK
jgi:hypothetical protein